MAAPIWATSRTGASRSSRAVGEVVQGGRDRQRRQRAVERVMPVLLAQQAAFDNGLGQLLEEQWHAVGAGEDLPEDLGRQRLAAGGALDQRHAVAAAEAGERQHRDVGVGGPGRGELRPRGDEEQQWQRRCPRHGQGQQLEVEVGSIQCASSNSISTGCRAASRPSCASSASSALQNLRCATQVGTKCRPKLSPAVKGPPQKQERTFLHPFMLEAEVRQYHRGIAAHPVVVAYGGLPNISCVVSYRP